MNGYRCNQECRDEQCRATCRQLVNHPECNGVCVGGAEFGVPFGPLGLGVAYAHPECEVHGGRRDAP